MYGSGNISEVDLSVYPEIMDDQMWQNNIVFAVELLQQTVLEKFFSVPSFDRTALKEFQPSIVTELENLKQNNDTIIQWFNFAFENNFQDLLVYKIKHDQALTAFVYLQD